MPLLHSPIDKRFDHFLLRLRPRGKIVIDYHQAVLAQVSAVACERGGALAVGIQHDPGASRCSRSADATTVDGWASETSTPGRAFMILIRGCKPGASTHRPSR